MTRTKALKPPADPRRLVTWKPPSRPGGLGLMTITARGRTCVYSVLEREKPSPDSRAFLLVRHTDAAGASARYDLYLSLEEMTCTCPAFLYGDHYCKHLEAVFRCLWRTRRRVSKAIARKE